ncbi:MAG: hypothetical protein ACK56I_37285, partial [bacterium]
WNAKHSVPLRVDRVLGVELDGGVLVRAQGPPVPQPFHGGRGLAAEPQVVPNGSALLQRDVVNPVADEVGRDEAVLGNHGLGGRAGLAGAALVHRPDSELVFVALHQAVAATLDLVAQLLHLLEGEDLALHPLAHVLLLHLDDVMGDLSTTVRLWRSPGPNVIKL